MSEQYNQVRQAAIDSLNGTVDLNSSFGKQIRVVIQRLDELSKTNPEEAMKAMSRIANQNMQQPPQGNVQEGMRMMHQQMQNPNMSEQVIQRMKGMQQPQPQQNLMGM